MLDSKFLFFFSSSFFVFVFTERELSLILARPGALLLELHPQLNS